MYANAYGISFPNKWTYEFAATYFAYFYLDQNFPKQSEIWFDVSKILVKELTPRYTSLNDFEEMCVRVGGRKLCLLSSSVFTKGEGDVHGRENRFLKETERSTMDVNFNVSIFE
jgi:hypothetical protein